MFEKMLNSLFPDDKTIEEQNLIAKMKTFYGINFEAFEDFLKGKLPYAWSRLFTNQFLIKKE